MQRLVEVIDAEEQDQSVPRLRAVRAEKSRMLVGAPRVQAEQDRAIPIENLPEVLVGRRRGSQPEERLIPRDAAGHVRDAEDGPQALHRGSRMGARVLSG